jgi:RHS repeat-associated protein
VEVNGSTVIGPVTDSTFTSGEASLWSYQPSSAGTHRFDNFSITVLGGGQPPAGKVLARRVLPQSAPTPAPNQVYRLYYYAGATRVAVRVRTGATGANDLYFLHSDHLGSTTVTTDLSQNIVGQQRYFAYGEPRWSSGALHTDRRFTGQREESGLGSLYDYNARYYSPYLNRWLQPDSIVPDAGNPQDLNRYSFVRNNPLKYTDPTGHYVCSGYNEQWGSQTCYDMVNTWLDFLYKFGGDEGKQLVEQFRASDAEWTIEFVFASLNGPAGQTDITNKRIKLEIGNETSRSYTVLGEQSARLGHELVHLLRQNALDNGTARSEKEAYDVQARLLSNMGITPTSETDPVLFVAPLAPDDLEGVSYWVGAPTTIDLYRAVVGGLGAPVARPLVVAYQAVTNCYGSVCIVPGGTDAHYNPPTVSTREGPAPRRR